MLDKIVIHRESFTADELQMYDLLAFVAEEPRFLSRYRGRISDTTMQFITTTPQGIHEYFHDLRSHTELSGDGGYDMLSTLATSWNKLATSKTDYVMFSSFAHFRAPFLSQHGLSARSAILLLASAGLEFYLPNVRLETLHWDEVCEVKEKLSEERSNYLIAVAALADEAYKRLASGVYDDTVDWARNEATFKILPKAEALQQQLHKLDRDLLKRIGVGFFREGIPVIGKAFGEGGIKDGSAAVIAQTLKTLCVSLSKNIEEKRAPEANYGLKLSQAFDSRPVL